MRFFTIILFLFSIQSFAADFNKELNLENDSDFYRDIKVNLPQFDFKRLLGSIDSVVYSDVVSIKQSGRKKDDMVFVTFDDGELGQAQESVDALIELTAESVDIEKKIVKKLGGFEVEFMDSEEDNLSDSGSGAILINDSEMFKDIRSLKVKEIQHLNLNAQIQYDNNEMFITFPMFEKSSFYKKFEEYSNRGYLIIEMSENIKSSVIDVDFENKYFLDNKYNIVDPAKSEYLFELYSGVVLGNVRIDYISSSKNKFTKFSHIYENEITFEQNIINKSKAESYSFGITNIYGADEDLLLNKEQVYDISVDTDLTVNAKNIELKLNNYLLTQRKIFELRFPSETIFVGTGTNKKLSIPSRGFTDKVYNIFNIDSLVGQCIVQVNLNKQFTSSFISGYAGNQFLNQEVFYLDVDGQFYPDLTRESKKMFIRTYLEDYSGSVFIELTSENGDKRNITTFCESNNYLVEHL